MGEYLKLFKNHKEYKQYISGEVEELPKISHCIQEIELHITDYKENYFRARLDKVNCFLVHIIRFLAEHQ